MGIDSWGLSPLFEMGLTRRSVYQMTTSREQARGGVGRVSGIGHPYPFLAGFCSWGQVKPIEDAR